MAKKVQNAKTKEFFVSAKENRYAANYSKYDRQKAGGAVGAMWYNREAKWEQIDTPAKGAAGESVEKKRAMLSPVNKKTEEQSYEKTI